MNDYEKKSPYKGVIIMSIIMIIIPIFLCFLFEGVISDQQGRYGEEVNKNTALFLGCGAGLIFQLSCALCGAFKGMLKVVIKRIVGFFSNLSISFRVAIITYWDDLKEDGAAFWIFFIIIVVTLSICLKGLFNCLVIFENL